MINRIWQANLMKDRLIKFFLVSLALFGASLFAAEHPELKAFPAAKESMERFVILLPHKTRVEEDAYKVELVAGKEMLTDGVNLVRLASSIEARNLEGWGYTYYEVTGSSETISTMMAPPQGSPKVKQFVKTSPLLINYNSRLPVVVYAPKGFEVHYRIFKAPQKTLKAKKG